MQTATVKMLQFSLLKCLSFNIKWQWWQVLDLLGSYSRIKWSLSLSAVLHTVCVVCGFLCLLLFFFSLSVRITLVWDGYVNKHVKKGHRIYSIIYLQLLIIKKIVAAFTISKAVNPIFWKKGHYSQKLFLKKFMVNHSFFFFLYNLH